MQQSGAKMSWVTFAIELLSESAAVLMFHSFGHPGKTTGFATVSFLQQFYTPLLWSLDRILSQKQHSRVGPDLDLYAPFVKWWVVGSSDMTVT